MKSSIDSAEWLAGSRADQAALEPSDQAPQGDRRDEWATTLTPLGAAAVGFLHRYCAVGQGQ